MTTPKLLPESAASLGSGEADLQSAVAALLSAAAAAEIEFDSRAVRDAMARAVLAHPGDWADTWCTRLKVVAAEMQLQCFEGTQSILDVFNLPRPRAPVIVYVPGSRSSSNWLILADRRLRKVLAESGSGLPEWKTPRHLIRQMNLAGLDHQVTFLALESAVPCSPATQHHGRPDQPSHDLSPGRRLVRLLRLDSRDLWVVAIFAVGVGILGLATPITVELLVNTIAFGSLVQPVVLLSLVLFLCLTFMVSMQLIQTYVVEILQRRLFVRCLADLAYRLPRVPVAAYDGSYGPELVNRFFDVAIFQKSLASLLLDGVFIALQAVVGMVVLASYHPYLLGYDVVMLAIVLAIVFFLGRGATRTAINESAAKYEAAGWLEELARQSVSIKMASGPEMATVVADHFARRYLSARSEHFRILLRQIVASFGLQVLSSTVLLGLGGWLVIQRELTLGQLVAAELIVSNIARAFAKLGKHFESYYDLLASTNKLGHLFDLPMERPTGETLPNLGNAVTVQITELEFAHPTGRELFGGLNLEIAAHDRVAVAGNSASGKSTLLELIYGLRMPSRGNIRLDGVDLRQLNLGALRSHITLVRKPDLLTASVFDNVRWGRTDVTLSEANTALAAVGLLDSVLRMPAGLETRITPEGRPLSDGQARALTIARAIASRPRLLLLDGMLDEMESDLFERITPTIFDPGAPWTLLIVTNRDDILRRCNKRLRLPERAVA